LSFPIQLLEMVENIKNPASIIDQTLLRPEAGLRGMRNFLKRTRNTISEPS